MLAFTLIGALLLSPASPSATPQDATASSAGSETLYWDVPLREVSWTTPPEEAVLLQVESTAQAFWWGNSTRVVLEGGGEAYTYSARAGRDQPGWTPGPVRLVASSPAGADTNGLIVAQQYSASAHRLEFSLPVERASAGAREAFMAGRAEHHQYLLNQRIPGGAWFRHGTTPEEFDAVVLDLTSPINTDDELMESFALFAGGRAVAENLQLDRLFPRAPTAGAEPEPDVLLRMIKGIEIREYDWAPLLEGVGEVELDPLLTWIPHDQHVLLTPSFQAFVALIDELELRASPLVAMMEASASSAGSREAMEEQLALSLNGLTRLLGPALIERVAITGGDLYLRTGTDVTLLFDCRDVAPVALHLRNQYDAAATADPEVTRASEGGVESVVAPFRRVSSYFTVEDDVVIVSNSRAALERVRAARTGKNLASLDETRYFRSRYPLGGGAEFDESAFILMTDAAIRRWCGPKWRIAASRRLRALAALLDLQATHVDELAAGLDTPRALAIEDERYPELGQVTLTSAGVHSSMYGSLGRMTPIVEMSFESVPASEARLYERWRDGYARNWTGAFDPIAARVSIDKESFEADLTIMPLIDNTEYRELREWTRQAQLGPLDGDPHAGTLFHFALAVDPKSPEVLAFQEMLSGFSSGEVANVLSWMTGSIAVFADEDEVWDVVLEAEDLDEAMESLYVELNDLPVVISVGSSSPLKLAGWMTALRGFVNGSSPGSIQWATKEDEEGNAYVKISGDDFLDNDEHILYATLREALVLSLNEQTLLETMKRYKSRRAQASGEGGAVAGDANPWLGESAAMSISRQGIAVFGSLMGDSIGEEAQRSTFANLHILNEWKRLFPNEDPVEVHRRVLGEELRCAAGGEFVWDAKWMTMSSTVLGHPAAPLPPPHLPPAIGDLEQLDAGLTFEQDGLRARVRALR